MILMRVIVNSKVVESIYVVILNNEYRGIYVFRINIYT